MTYQSQSQNWLKLVDSIWSFFFFFFNVKEVREVIRGMQKPEKRESPHYSWPAKSQSLKRFLAQRVYYDQYCKQKIKYLKQNKNK